MVIAKLQKKDNQIYSLEVSGHANAKTNELNNDLVCAGITAIVSGALNAFDTMFSSNVDLNVGQNNIWIKVVNNSKEVQDAFEFLLLQLKTVEIQYSKNFKIEEV